MNALTASHAFARLAAATGAALLVASTALAQGAVGSGPLTATLADKEPEVGVFKIGPLLAAPGLTIREIGRDDNVFDEAADPKSDYVVAGTPDVSVFTRLRFVQVSAYAGSEMQYYQTYESERSIGQSLRGRVDVLMGRLSPFFGGGSTRNRTRPNGEVDVRADIKNSELSGGLAYELSANARVFGAVIQTENALSDALQSGVDLRKALSQQARQYQAGLRTDLTPLLAVQLAGGYRKDEFQFDPLRNGEARTASVAFSIDTAAVISGSATIGFQDYQPVDPLVARFRGVTGSGFITYPFLEIGRFNFGYNRGTQYSFDAAEAYYLENTVSLTYTHRLAGEVDVQGQTSRSFFSYGNRVGSAPRQDSLELYNGNLGYNLRNRTRISANYEYARRHSPDLASRNYIRRRIYLSWMVAF
jgi:hypothetical protein